MKRKPGFLVVGGDSLVGGGLLRVLRGRGHFVLASTRRRDSLGGGRIFLDFEGEAPFRAPDTVDYAFIVAAATNYDRCEKDPQARIINVELIPRLVGGLLEQGLFVTFISTNSVFGGERPWPHEDDPHAPGIAYARQKSEAEQVIWNEARRLGAGDRLSITRLTKIMDHTTSPLPAWFAAWAKGEAIQPFSDLVFAPMSVRFVGEALAILGEKRQPGNLHLSGAENVSYVDLANHLAATSGVNPALVRPTTATEKGVHIAFKPKYSGIGMKKTGELTGLKPQPLADVVLDIMNGLNQEKQKGER